MWQCFFVLTINLEIKAVNILVLFFVLLSLESKYVLVNMPTIVGFYLNIYIAKKKNNVFK